jgi:hypothetical protein
MNPDYRPSPIITQSATRIQVNKKSVYDKQSGEKVHTAVKGTIRSPQKSKSSRKQSPEGRNSEATARAKSELGRE